MDRETIREQMEEIRAELDRLDSSRAGLESVLKGFEAWLRVNPENGSRPQQHVLFTVPGRGGPMKGTVSFRSGLLTVVRQAHGEPLTEAEIWLRMQELGVRSDAKKPVGFVGLTANRQPEVEKVAPKLWRWISAE